MIIRRFKNEDSAELSEVIAKTLRTTNIKDYSPEFIEKEVEFFTPEKLIERATWIHFMLSVKMRKSSVAAE